MLKSQLLLVFVRIWICCAYSVDKKIIRSLLHVLIHWTVINDFVSLSLCCCCHCSLYPGDLYSFTRRPCFLIVDSDNSSAFAQVPQHFDQPIIVLMSPQDVPTTFRGISWFMTFLNVTWQLFLLYKQSIATLLDQNKTFHIDYRDLNNIQQFEIINLCFFLLDNAHKGSLYSLFLHSPLSAFCFVTNIVDIPIHLWDKCLAYVDRFMTEASRLITRCRGVGEIIWDIWAYLT